MNRARLGALGTAAVLAPALLLTAGCGAFVDGFKEGYNEAANTVEVCNAAIDQYNKMNTTLDTAATELSSATDKAAALTKFNTQVAAEFTTLHKGLQAQVEKATAADLKKALKALDGEVAVILAKPDLFTEDATTAKLDEATKNVNTACDAKRPEDK
jgi:hypothetical protein